MLRDRALSALVFVPFIVLALWLGEPWVSLLVGAVALGGVWELYGIARQAHHRPLVPLGLLLTALFILNPHSPDPRTSPLLLTLAVALPFLWLLFRRKMEGAFADGLWTLAGALYLGWMLGNFISLRTLEHGREWAVLAVFGTFAVDTSAYFVGRALGRHALVPILSPGKTWEGAVGGLAGGMAATFALSALLRLPLGWLETAALGLLLAVFAQLGDLVESLLKRSTGVKDAGNLIPGHGGLLDRLDSLIFGGAVVYYYVIWVVK